MISFAEKYPHLINEWDYEKNGEKTPYNTSYGSAIPIHWKCIDCGHEWVVAPNGRARNRGCPKCAIKKAMNNRNNNYINKKGSLNKINPELAQDWNYNKNTKSPSDYLPSSNESVWWKCNFCEHEWEASINSRNRGNGCPKCSQFLNTSSKQKIIFYYIKKVFPDTMLNVKNDILPFLNNYELDIYIPSQKIAIEYDGVKYHKNKKDNDIIKNDICKNNNIHLIRIREKGLSKLSDNDITLSNNHNINDFEKTINELFTILSHKTHIKFPTISLSDDENELNAFVYDTKRKISFATEHPDLLIEWNHEKNKGLNPENIPPQNNMYIWWKCSTCGFEWKSTLSSYIKGHKCRKCGRTKAANSKSINVSKNGNSIAIKNPDLAKQWDYSRNPPDRSPENVSPWSDKKFFWICPNCNLSFPSTVTNRTMGQGCPACAKIKRSKKRKKQY